LLDAHFRFLLGQSPSAYPYRQALSPLNPTTSTRRL
jgi:hypothetical protein